MDRVSFEKYLEPPPRWLAPAEALPHLGGLALAPYRGALPDEIEPHQVTPLEGAFDQAHSEQILKRTLDLSKVRDRFARGRVKVIGVSRRGEVEKGEPRTYLVVAYDYLANLAIEVTVNEQGEPLQIAEERYQPPLIESEIDRAVELARTHDRLQRRVEGLVPMAIPYSGPNDEFAGRRVVEVLFGCRSERLPKYRAWVDLGADQVLFAGESCPCCHQRNEEAHS